MEEAAKPEIPPRAIIPPFFAVGQLTNYPIILSKSVGSPDFTDVEPYGLKFLELKQPDT